MVGVGESDGVEFGVGVALALGETVAGSEGDGLGEGVALDVAVAVSVGLGVGFTISSACAFPTIIALTNNITKNIRADCFILTFLNSMTAELLAQYSHDLHSKRIILA